MSTSQQLIWWGLTIVGIFGASIFGGLETGLYTLNRIRLHVAAHTRGSSAALLEKLLLNPNKVIATLLVGVNISHYVITLGVSAIMAHAGLHGSLEILTNIAIVTPLLLIVGEILPKDLFRSHSDVLTYPFARPLWAMQKLLTWIGLLPLIDGVSWLIRRVFHGSVEAGDISHPRRVVTQLMKEGVGHGVITPYQSDMIDRVLQINKLKLSDVMLPWSEVAVVRANQPPEAIWSLADRLPFARLPLVDIVGKPIGIIEVNDVLKHDPANCPPLESLAQPLPSLPPDTSLQKALVHIQERGASMVLVKDHGKPLGIVTAKSLVEPIVGELGAW